MTLAHSLQLAIDGLIIGGLYALVGLGVVIVFRATRVLNFAEGGVATTAGYAAAMLNGEGMPYVGALAIAVVIGLAMGAVIGLVMTRVFVRAGVMERSIGSLGIAFVLAWANRTVFGEIPRLTPEVFNGNLDIAGVILPGHGLYVLAISVLAILFTMWLVNSTRLGLAMRALSQDAPIARAYGVSNDLVSIASWAIASGLAALSGVLVSSFIQADQNVMTVIAIQSLLAVVLGGFGTAAGAIVGGLALGIAASLVAGFLEPAFKNTFVFAVVLLALMVRPQGLVGRKEIVVQESGQTSNLPALPARSRSRRSALTVAAIAVAALAALPFVPRPFPVVTLSVLFGTATVVMALGFLMGFTGEISLGHGALASVGAYVTAYMLLQAGVVSLPVALLLAVLVAAAVGAVIAWVMLRLSGLYLAIATMTFTYVVVELAQRLRPITGGPLGLNVAGPFGEDRVVGQLGIYYLAAAAFLVVAMVLELVLASRHALYWVAIRDVPVAALANGVHIRRQKVLSFTLSSAIAGIGGAVLAIAISHIGPLDYGLNWSFVAILAVVLGGVGSTLGALGGTAVVVLLPVAISQTAYTELVFGAAIVLLMALAPRGVPGAIERVRAPSGVPWPGQPRAAER